MRNWYIEFVKIFFSEYHSCIELNIINYLDKGNTTTYEWIYGEAPLSISEPPLNINLDNDDLEKKKAVDVDNTVCEPL